MVLWNLSFDYQLFTSAVLQTCNFLPLLRKFTSKLLSLKLPLGNFCNKFPMIFCKICPQVDNDWNFSTYYLDNIVNFSSNRKHKCMFYKLNCSQVDPHCAVTSWSDWSPCSVSCGEQIFWFQFFVEKINILLSLLNSFNKSFYYFSTSLCFNKK